MKIYYLDNSGFALEIGSTLLVIDCYSFTEHPEKSRFEKGYVDDEKLPGYQKVYVLASHIHGDHFNPEIFGLVRYNKNTFYILEKDIPAPGGVSAAFLGVGERFSDGTIFVRAWPSTDIGVSFEIKIEGKSIFHAGDLNCWHWREESTEERSPRRRRTLPPPLTSSPKPSSSRTWPFSRWILVWERIMTRAPWPLLKSSPKPSFPCTSAGVSTRRQPFGKRWRIIRFMPPKSGEKKSFCKKGYR